MGGLSGTLMLWVVCCSLLGDLKASVCWLAATHQGRGELPLPWCHVPPSREICGALLTEHSFPQTSKGTDSQRGQKNWSFSARNVLDSLSPANLDWASGWQTLLEMSLRESGNSSLSNSDSG